MITRTITVGEGTRYPLKGILTLPDNTQQAPAVVFVHGSGSSNMDEKVGKLTPFKDLAEGLAKHGIASLRYDKRSFAHGLKMMREKEPITVRQETIEDAILATKLLRSHPAIDPRQIYIIGHSMGGMLAPRIDAEGGDFAGLILLAGSPRNLDEILLEQTREMLEKSGKITRFILSKQLKTLEETFAPLDTMTDEEAKQKKMGGGTTLYYFKEMNSHPVSQYLKKLEKPVLVMQGGKDFQVKADKDFARYQELLAGKPNASFKLYENLNHCFVPSVYGDITKAKQEYNVEQHIGENIIVDIANWIHAASK